MQVQDTSFIINLRMRKKKAIVRGLFFGYIVIYFYITKKGGGMHTLKCLVMAFSITVINPCNAITLSNSDNAATEKIQYMQKVSGNDASMMGALIQADQSYTQWCGKSATREDLKKIVSSPEFQGLYQQLKSGKSLGMTQTKNMLIIDKKKFCRGS